MANFLEVSPNDILALDDTSFRTLIAKLYIAEVRAQKFSPSAVTFGGHQNAKDGGIDVRVSLPDGATVSGYLPKPEIGTQVKAEDMPPSKIASEMMPDGVLRPAIQQLADTRGAYILASSKGSTADQPLKERIQKMQECAATNGAQENIHLDFYDRDRIATWVSQHPSVIPWLRVKAGRDVTGWQSYSAWAYDEGDEHSEFVVDEKTRIFASETSASMDVTAALEDIRKTLATPKSSVRLVGLSGVGKTRLIQALFDQRVGSCNSCLNPSQVLYTDLSHNPHPQPTILIDALIARGDQCVVVVDNCGAQLHNTLAEKVRKTNSSLSLISAEYDIRDDLSEGTFAYRMEPSSPELITEIVRRKYPSLSRPDLDKIAEFSDGNARIAFALAATSQESGDLSTLKDQQLFERLFHQKHTENEAMLRSAELLSLVYSFNGQEVSGTTAELPALGAIADVSVQELYAYVELLRQRGLVQTRSKWRAVLPHAIANRLAENALQLIPPEIVCSQLLSEGNERLAKSFSRRLGYLHNSVTARKIVRGWLIPDGFLADISKLTEYQFAMFRNIAPVLPEVTLETIRRCAESQRFNDLGSFQKSAVIGLIRNIAYDANRFSECVVLLSKLALASKKDIKESDASKALQSLFQIYYSGTHAPAELRAECVRNFLSSPDNEIQQLGVYLLDATLHRQHIGSPYILEFGARQRDYGWLPASKTEETEWLSTFIDIAVEYGRQDNPTGLGIRRSLANHIRSLSMRMELHEKIGIAANAFRDIDGWPDGWRNTRSTLRFDRKGMSKPHLDWLVTLEKLLAPHDLQSEIDAYVLCDHFFDYEDLEASDNPDVASQLETARARKKRLAEQLAADWPLFLKLLPKFLTCGQSGVHQFSLDFGRTVGCVQRALNAIESAISQIDHSEFRISFVSGFVSGAIEQDTAAVSAFLDRAMISDHLATQFPVLQSAANLGPVGFQRLLKSVDLGIAPIEMFQCLAYGRSTFQLSVNQIGQLLRKLATRGTDKRVGTEILGMVVADSKDRDSSYKQELGTLCRDFMASIDWKNVETNSRGLCSYHLSEISIQAVSETGHAEFAINVVDSIFRAEADHHLGLMPEGRAKVIGPLLAAYPQQLLDHLLAVSSEDHREMMRLLDHGYREHSKAPIDHIAPSDLVDWCDIDPEKRYPLIAGSCKVFEGREQENPQRWTEIALSLLKSAPDKVPILKLICQRIRPSTWSGLRSTIIRNRVVLLDELAKLDLGLPSHEIQSVKSQLLAEADEDEKWEQQKQSEKDMRFE